MKRKILKQTYSISSSLDHELALIALKAQLDDKVFEELMKNDKGMLTLTFIIEVDDKMLDEIKI